MGGMEVVPSHNKVQVLQVLLQCNWDYMTLVLNIVKCDNHFKLDL